MQNREKTQMASNKTKAETSAEIEDKFYNLIWWLDLEHRYQTARSSFVGKIEKIVTLLIILFSIIGLLGYACTLCSIISLFCGIALIIFDTNKLQLVHTRLKERLANLLTLAKTAEKNSANYIELSMQKSQIESKIDEHYMIVEALCYNEIIKERLLDSNNSIAIPKWMIPLKHLMRFSSFDLTSKKHIID